MYTLKEAFGKKLKTVRKARGLTQEQIAEYLSLTPRQLTRIECGKSFPSVETLARLCLVLNIEICQLFNFSWDSELTLISYGNDNEFCYVKSVNGVIDTAKYLKIEDLEGSSVGEINFSQLAIKTKKPIVVEYFENGKRDEVKTYFPNGQVEVQLSKQQIKNDTLAENVIKKVKSNSNSQRRLEFINLAIESLENKKSLKELKSIIKGMELI